MQALFRQINSWFSCLNKAWIVKYADNIGKIIFNEKLVIINQHRWIKNELFYVLYCSISSHKYFKNIIFNIKLIRRQQSKKFMSFFSLTRQKQNYFILYLNEINIFICSPWKCNNRCKYHGCMHPNFILWHFLVNNWLFLSKNP